MKEHQIKKICRYATLVLYTCHCLTSKESIENYDVVNNFVGVYKGILQKQ